MVGSSIRAIAHQDYQSKSLRLTSGLLIGTVPILIVGLLLKKTLDAPNSPFRSLMVIGIASIAMSVLLAIAELRGNRKRDFHRLTLLD